MVGENENLNLWAAINAFQQENVKIVKDTQVSFGQTNYAHAKLEDILEKINPDLVKHRILISHYPSQTSIGTPALTMHVRLLGSDEWFETVMALPLSKNDPQAMGSAITYLRRYSIGALLRLHLVDDDDGITATYQEDPRKVVKAAVTPVEEPIGLINEKAVKIILAEIKDNLDEGQQNDLKAWMIEKNFSLKDSLNVVDGDLEEIYRKISEVREEI